jgi:hypothetical protein
MAEPLSPVIMNNPNKETVLGAGDIPNAMPLPVYRHPGGMLSRWKFTEQEIAWIVANRCIYLNVNTWAHPPIDIIAEPVGLRPDGVVCVLMNQGNDPLERLARISEAVNDPTGATTEELS